MRDLKTEKLVGEAAAFLDAEPGQLPAVIARFQDEITLLEKERAELEKQLM